MRLSASSKWEEGSRLSNTLELNSDGSLARLKGLLVANVYR